MTIHSCDCQDTFFLIVNECGRASQGGMRYTPRPQTCFTIAVVLVVWNAAILALIAMQGPLLPPIGAAPSTTLRPLPKAQLRSRSNGRRGHGVNEASSGGSATSRSHEAMVHELARINTQLMRELNASKAAAAAVAALALAAPAAAVATVAAPIARALPAALVLDAKSNATVLRNSTPALHGLVAPNRTVNGTALLPPPPPQLPPAALAASYGIAMSDVASVASALLPLPRPTPSATSSATGGYAGARSPTLPHRGMPAPGAAAALPSVLPPVSSVPALSDPMLLPHPGQLAKPAVAGGILPSRSKAPAAPPPGARGPGAASAFLPARPTVHAAAAPAVAAVAAASRMPWGAPAAAGAAPPKLLPAAAGARASWSPGQ